MSSMKAVCSIGFISVILVLLLPVHLATAEQQLTNEAAGMKLESLAGEMKSLNDYQGKKVVVHFFATWCHPCQEEMPYIVSFSKRVQEAGAMFVPIHLTHLDQDLSQLHSFLTYYQADFDPLLDTSGEMMNTFHVIGIPTTLFMDEKGQVTQRIDGMLPEELANSFLEQVKKVN